MIYLRFITERWQIESMLIRLGTRSWASHVEFVRLDDQGNAVDTLGSRLGDGVQVRPYNYCNPTAEQWYTAPGIDVAYKEGLTLVGRKYDWLDIIGIVTNKNWRTDLRFICSEFVAFCGERAWALAGTAPWLNPDTEVWRITPRDLLLAPRIAHVRTIK